MKSEIINNFIKICGKKHVLTENWNKETYCKGWRYGSGEAIAVVKPGTLLEIWKVLNICNESNLIIIMQAANTGLTGGSTPYGEDYDRDIVIINTMRINDIHLLDNAKQIIGLTGSTLYDLERKLDPYDREPHSVIGSTSIGASIIGGVCNNSQLVELGEIVSPHLLRHTFATHILNKGADLNSIKDLLGHESLAATQIYTHNSIEKLKETFKASHPRA